MLTTHPWLALGMLASFVYSGAVLGFVLAPKHPSLPAGSTAACLWLNTIGSLACASVNASNRPRSCHDLAQMCSFMHATEADRRSCVALGSTPNVGPADGAIARADTYDQLARECCAPDADAHACTDYLLQGPHALGSAPYCEYRPLARTAALVAPVVCEGTAACASLDLSACDATAGCERKSYAMPDAPGFDPSGCRTPYGVRGVPGTQLMF